VCSSCPISCVYRIEINSGVEDIVKIDAITRAIVAQERAIFIFPAKLFITPATDCWN